MSNPLCMAWGIGSICSWSSSSPRILAFPPSPSAKTLPGRGSEVKGDRCLRPEGRKGGKKASFLLFFPRRLPTTQAQSIVRRPGSRPASQSGLTQDQGGIDRLEGSIDTLSALKISIKRYAGYDAKFRRTRKERGDGGSSVFHFFC